MNEKPIGCRCGAQDDPEWHSKECWIRQTDALRQQLAEARDLAAHAEFDHDHYELVKQRLAEALGHLHANDAALGLTGVESRPQAMYIRDLQQERDRLFGASEHWHALYKDCAAEQADEAARYGQQIVDLEQQLAHVTAENPTLRQQCLTVAQRFSAYLPEPLEPEDCDELMHYIEDMVQHER